MAITKVSGPKYVLISLREGSGGIPKGNGVSIPTKLHSKAGGMYAGRFKSGGGSSHGNSISE